MLLRQNLPGVLFFCLMALGVVGSSCSGGSGSATTEDVGSATDTGAGLPDGAANDGGVTCPTECDPAACQVCEKGSCVSECTEDEVCEAGSCVAAPPECDANMCEALDPVSGECASSCDADACEACDGEGACVSACEADDCEACDGEGSCVTECNGDDCEVCDGAGTCVVGCDAEACETCNGVGGCLPGCDTAACEACDGEGGCSTTCDADACETCDGAGNCAVSCDADACEVCDGLGSCVVSCDADACETCDGEGGCVSACDADACQVCDGEGSCGYACDPETEYCRESECRTRPILTCGDADGYCLATAVSALALAPDQDTADEQACCCDLSGDGKLDNGLARLVELVGLLMGYDRAYFNDFIAQMIARGGFLPLFEFLGIDNDLEDDYVEVNFYMGATDGLPNFGGSGEFWILPDSVDELGQALITFDSAWIGQGRLHAGPGRFLVPLMIMGAPDMPNLVIENAFMEADLTRRLEGYDMANGTMCGYVRRDTVMEAVNEYVTTACDCLRVGTELLLPDGDGWTCAEVPGQTTCDPTDEVGELCLQLGSNCTSFVAAMGLFLDLDHDRDGRGDAISVGTTFEGAPANIVGVATLE